MLLEQAPGTIPTGVLREVGNEDVGERDRECARPEHPAGEEEPRFFAGVGSTNRPTGEQSSRVHQYYEHKAEQPIELSIDLLDLEDVGWQRQRECNQQCEPERKWRFAEQLANRQETEHSAEAVFGCELGLEEGEIEQHVSQQNRADQ